MATPEAPPEARKRSRRRSLVDRDREWLRLHDHGWTSAEIGRKYRIHGAHVARRVTHLLTARSEAPKPEPAPAAAKPPRLPAELLLWLEGLVPLFPIGGNPFRPDSPCPHRCRKCGGAGTVVVDAKGEDGKPARKAVECPTCRGVPFIPAGSVFCCMCCHRSGQDKHPHFRPSARDPRPEPTPEPPPAPAAPAETRRQRRARSKPCSTESASPGGP